MANDMVTRAQAEAVLALVEQKYSAYVRTYPWVDGKFDFTRTVLVSDENRPQIVEYQVGENDTQLAIVWESNAPYEWALEPLTENSVDPEFGFGIKGAKGDMPKGVRAEPYFSFVLVLYKEV
jgi:hypothetical protein